MSDGPRVAVLGGGAMGSLFGGLLSEGGLDVVLVDKWREHIDQITRTGLRITGYGGDRLVPVAATTDPKTAGPVDVVLVQTKGYHTADAVRSAAAMFRGDAVAISFQNGLGNEETIGEIIGTDHVLGGVTAQGASIVEPGLIENFADLPSHIGELKGGISERARRIADAFTTAGLRTAVSNDITRDIWKKLMANVAISPLSALCNMRVGEVFDVGEVKETVVQALTEAAAVAKAAGVDLDASETMEMLNKVTGPGGTGGNRPSMLMDVLNRRKTEIDYINGAVVRLGKQHGVPTPVNATLVAAIKGLERDFA